jgi:hypothetical protein
MRIARANTKEYAVALKSPAPYRASGVRAPSRAGRRALAVIALAPTVAVTPVLARANFSPLASSLISLSQAQIAEIKG